MTHVATQPVVRQAERVEDALRGDLVPERVQLLEPLLGGVAGNQGRVDRADGNAGDPIRMQIGLDQPLIHARLEGPERSAALQQQSDALERRPLQPDMALSERLHERPLDLLGGLHRSRFDIDRARVALRCRRGHAGSSVTGGHARQVLF